MSVILRCLLIYSLCTSLAHAGGGLEFWNGAREGMSEREVLKLFPAATKPSDPESLITGTLNNFRRTAIEGLRDCTLTYEDLPACGRFYFEDKKLVGVDVELRDLDRTQPARTAEIGAHLRDKLAQQLGSEPQCEYFKASDTSGPAGTCEWHAGPERIRLSYFHGLMPKISETDKVAITVSFRRVGPT